MLQSAGARGGACGSALPPLVMTTAINAGSPWSKARNATTRREWSAATPIEDAATNGCSTAFNTLLRKGRAAREPSADPRVRSTDGLAAPWPAEPHAAEKMWSRC